MLFELPVGLLAWDKGFLYTSKALFTRPGEAIREYIAGKRVLHFRPLPMLAFCAGILGLLGVNMLVPEDLTDTEEKQRSMKLVIDWMNSRYVWLELALLPVMSLSTWAWFRKRGYNLVEHVVINAFLASQRLLLNIVLFPILLLSSNMFVLMGQGSLVTVGSFGLFVWSFVTLFDKGDSAVVVLRTIAAYLTAFLLLGLIGASIGAYLAYIGRLTFV